MLFFVGLIVLFGAILGGYLPHGNIWVLWQPLEFIIIAGAAMGGFIIANPKNVIMGAVKGLGRVIKGSPHSKETYLKLLTLLYTILRVARTQGALALEAHVDRPESSEIFTRFPNFHANTHAVTFLCDYLRMMTMGTENAHQMEALIDEEIETHHLEQAQVTGAISAVGDGLPAFGIVAAVLGVITTMGSILEPPEILGGMIGAALVGTFLGVLLAYGIVLPMAHSLKACDKADIKYYHCIKAALIAHMQGHSPGVAIEFARKILYSVERPSFIEVEDAVNAVPSPA